MSRTKRFIYSVLVIVIGYAGVELTAYLALWRLDGEVFSPRRIERRQRRIVGSAQASTSSGDRAGLVRFINGIFYSIHPFIGFVLDPDRNPNVGDSVRGFPINADGFVGNERIAHKRSSDRLLVGVTGGSAALLFERLGGDVLRQELSRLPRFANREIVLVPLALGGFKQPQQLMTVSYLSATGGDLDILINLDGFNEVVLSATENMKTGVSPFYPRSWQMQAIPDPEAQRLIGKVSYLESLRESWARWFLRGRIHGSPLRALTWRLGDDWLGHELGSAQEELHDFHPSECGFGTCGPRYAYADQQSLLQDMAAFWRQSSILLDGVCKAAGIHYYHFLQPNQYDVDSKPMGPAERAAMMTNAVYGAVVPLAYPLLRAEGRHLVQHGVRFYDMSAVFHDVEQPLYVDDCCHFGKDGNEILARRIAAAIAQAE